MDTAQNYDEQLYTVQLYSSQPYTAQIYDSHYEAAQLKIRQILIVRYEKSYLRLSYVSPCCDRQATVTAVSSFP